MAHLSIHVTSINGSEDTDNINISGHGRVTGQSDQDPPINWNVDVAANAAAATIITAIRGAAIAAAEGMEFTVGALDKKTLYGFPMDLAL